MNFQFKELKHWCTESGWYLGYDDVETVEVYTYLNHLGERKYINVNPKNNEILDTWSDEDYKK